MRRCLLDAVMKGRERGAGGARCGPCLGRVRAHARVRAWREPGCAPAGGPDKDCRAIFKALHRLECAFNAYNALRGGDAGALSPAVEERLQALLVDRAMPLLLRCMQTWKGGARRTGRAACDACWAASLPALWRSRAGSLSRLDEALLGRWLLGSWMPCGSTCGVAQPAAAGRGAHSRTARRLFGTPSRAILPRSGSPRWLTGRDAVPAQPLHAATC